MSQLKCTLVIDDEVNARIGGLRSDHLASLYDTFGIEVDGYRYTVQYQLGRWDGKKRYFSETGVTYTKILEEVIPYLVGWGYDLDMEDRRAELKVIKDRIDTKIFGPNSREMRPYQVEVVNALLDGGSGFAVCATGAGKTVMCAALCSVLYKNGLQTVVIVPSTDLVDQTATEFREMYGELGITVGTYSGDQKNIDEPIVVATWQSLQNAPHYMSFFQAVIVDESHGVKAEVVRELINNHGRHIAFRYGVTGTYPKPKADQYALKTSIGLVLAEIPAWWLIQEGYLSSLEIHPVETQDMLGVDKGDLPPDYSSEKSYLIKSDERLEVIAKQVIAARDSYGNTMVLVNSIPQGQALEELIPGAVFLSGESKKKDRKSNYDQYADRDDLIVIATFGIASTGISIDRIFSLFLVDAGKSFIRAIQTVGRGLRKKGDKNHVHVFDVYSRLKFGKKHYNDRRVFYKEAQYPVAPKVIKLTYVPAGNGGLVF